MKVTEIPITASKMAPFPDDHSINNISHDHSAFTTNMEEEIDQESVNCLRPSVTVTPELDSCDESYGIETTPNSDDIDVSDAEPYQIIVSVVEKHSDLIKEGEEANGPPRPLSIVSKSSLPTNDLDCSSFVTSRSELYGGLDCQDVNIRTNQTDVSTAQCPLNFFDHTNVNGNHLNNNGNNECNGRESAVKDVLVAKEKVEKDSIVRLDSNKFSEKKSKNRSSSNGKATIEAKEINSSSTCDDAELVQNLKSIFEEIENTEDNEIDTITSKEEQVISIMEERMAAHHTHMVSLDTLYSIARLLASNFLEREAMFYLQKILHSSRLSDSYSSRLLKSRVQYTLSTLLIRCNVCFDANARLALEMIQSALDIQHALWDSPEASDELNIYNPCGFSRAHNFTGPSVNPLTHEVLLSYIQAGIVHHSLGSGNFDKAIKYFDMVLQFCDNVSEKDEEEWLDRADDLRLKVLMEMGKSSREKGDFEAALGLYERAKSIVMRKISDKIENDPAIVDFPTRQTDYSKVDLYLFESEISFSLGIIHDDMDEFDDSLCDYCNTISSIAIAISKDENLSTQTKLSLKKAEALLCMANIYFKIRKDYRNCSLCLDQIIEEIQVYGLYSEDNEAEMLGQIPMVLPEIHDDASNLILQAQNDKIPSDENVGWNDLAISSYKLKLRLEQLQHRERQNTIPIAISNQNDTEQESTNDKSQLKAIKRSMKRERKKEKRERKMLEKELREIDNTSFQDDSISCSSSEDEDDDDAEEEREENEHTFKMTSLFRELGKIYITTGELINCVKCLNKCLNLLEQESCKLSRKQEKLSKARLGNTLKGMSSPLLQLPSNDTEVTMLKFESNKVKIKIVKVLHLIGNAHHGLKNFDEAIGFYRRALKNLTEYHITVAAVASTCTCHKLTVKEGNHQPCFFCSYQKNVSRIFHGLGNCHAGIMLYYLLLAHKQIVPVLTSSDASHHQLKNTPLPSIGAVSLEKSSNTLDNDAVINYTCTNEYYNAALSILKGKKSFLPVTYLESYNESHSLICGEQFLCTPRPSGSYAQSTDYSKEKEANILFRLGVLHHDYLYFSSVVPITLPGNYAKKMSYNITHDEEENTHSMAAEDVEENDECSSINAACTISNIVGQGTNYSALSLSTIITDAMNYLRQAIHIFRSIKGLHCIVNGYIHQYIGSMFLVQHALIYQRIPNNELRQLKQEILESTPNGSKVAINCVRHGSSEEKHDNSCPVSAEQCLESLNNNGTLFRAEGHFLSSQNIFRLRLGNKCIQVAHTLRNLAFYYNAAATFWTKIKPVNLTKCEDETLFHSLKEKNRDISREYFLCKAIESYKDSILIYKQNKIEELPDMAKCLYSLGLLYSSCASVGGSTVDGNMHPEEFLVLAMKCYNEALRIWDKISKLTKGSICGMDESSQINAPNILSEVPHQVIPAVNTKSKNLKYISRKCQPSSFYHGHFSDMDVSNLLQRKAALHMQFNEYEDSAQCYHRALAIYKRGVSDLKNFTPGGLLSREGLTIAHISNKLGIVYAAMELYDGAIKFLMHSLEIRRLLVGSNHMIVSSTLHNIGNVYAKRGHHELAMRSYRDALKMRRSIASSHPSNNAKCMIGAASTLHNMGNCYYALYLSGWGKKLIHSTNSPSVPKRKPTGGMALSSSSDVLLSSLETPRSSFGCGSASLQALRMAGECYAESLRIRKNWLGLGHSSVADTMYKLGILVESRHLYHEALTYYRSALRIKREVFAKSLSDNDENLDDVGGLECANLLVSIANIYKKLDAEDRDGKARDNYLKAMSVYRCQIGNDCDELVTILNSMGSIHGDLANAEYDKAIGYHEEALGIIQRKLDCQISFEGRSEDNVDCNSDEKKSLDAWLAAQTLCQIGSLQSKQSSNNADIRRSQALHNLAECLRVFKSVLSESGDYSEFEVRLQAMDECDDEDDMYNSGWKRERAPFQLTPHRIQQHEDVAIALYYKGITHDKLEDQDDDAMKCFEESLRIYRLLIVPSDDIDDEDEDDNYVDYEHFDPAFVFGDNINDCSAKRKGATTVVDAKSIANEDMERKKEQRIRHSLHIARVLQMVGMVLTKRREYERSLVCFRESLQYRRNWIKRKRKAKQRQQSFRNKRNESWTSLESTIGEQFGAPEEEKYGNEDSEDKEIADIYFGMGIAFCEKGRQYDKSLQCYEKALQVRRETLGENHIEFAQVLNNMGSVYARKGFIDKAVILWEDTLRIYTRAGLPDDHERVVCTKDNMDVAKRLQSVVPNRFEI